MAHRTILIADDDVGLIRLLRTFLTPLGVEVRETYDSISALALIQRSAPDLVILDINMPGGNGLSACEMLITDKWLARVPVIILSGQSDDDTRERCQRMKAHYVRKGPDAAAEIRDLAARLLGLAPIAAAP